MIGLCDNCALKYADCKGNKSLEKTTCDYYKKPVVMNVKELAERIAELEKENAMLRKATPSAEAEWIPVSEKLPKDETTVITFDSMGDIEFGSHENGKWYWLAEACADYWTRNDGVIAWMPLPKPYKGGDDE